MGNTCCSSGNNAVVTKNRDDRLLEKDNVDKTNGNAENGAMTKTLLTGRIGNEDNCITSLRNGQMNRMQSEETIFYDAMDRFPSDKNMSYPPTQSMRQLSVDFDIREADTFNLLLNSSFRHLSSTTSIDPAVRPSVALVSKHLSTETPGTQGRGYPGELTEDELETCLEFREELKKRDPAFKQMVTAMHPHEKEAFALCRFLRARDFDIENVFTMLQEKNQVENWHAAKQKDPNLFKEFHSTIPEFNGCPLSVFLTQFPMIHTGIGKNGAVVVYARAGRVSCPGVECIVGDIANGIPFVWNRLFHGCRDAMEREIARSDPVTTTVLAEKIIVADLAGDSSLFSSGMPLLKVSPTAVACFPEAVNRTYILNAPFSFSIVWTVLKQLLDPRTVQKIGFFSTIPKAKKDFLEYIDSDELLSTYGGTGKSFDDAFAARQQELAHKEGVVRYVVELLAMTGRQAGFNFDLSSDEMVDSIVVYSRSDNMCSVSIVDGKSNSIVETKNISRNQATSKGSDSPNNDISHNNYAVEIATSKDFAADSKGPFSINTKGGTKGDYFLVAISIAEKRAN